MKIEFPNVMTVVSKRNSGKSFFLNFFLLIHYKEFKHIVLMSRTAKYTKDYCCIRSMKQMAPSRVYIGDFNLEVVKKYIEIGKTTKEPVLLLLDDIVGALRGREQVFMSDLTTYSRHLNMTLIMSFQKATGSFTPTMRQNTDYFLWSRLNDANLKTIAENITDVEFKKIKQLTKKLKQYEFILYDNLRDTGFFKVKAQTRVVNAFIEKKLHRIMRTFDKIDFDIDNVKADDKKEDKKEDNDDNSQFESSSDSDSDASESSVVFS